MAVMLIADDNPQLLKILTSAAQREGFDTVLAQDGKQALEQYRVCKPQVILLDVMMPELDGFQVGREIRKESDVPVIMITARGEDFEKIMRLDIGADGEIELELKRTEVGFRIAVTDHGVGISPDELPAIFERFQKVRSPQNSTGTGLGLPIVKQIANRHGAKIQVESNAQKTSFSVDLTEKYKEAASR